VRASFLDPDAKQALLAEIDAVAAGSGSAPGDVSPAGRGGVSLQAESALPSLRNRA
jgi:hypothetical protein